MKYIISILVLFTSLYAKDFSIIIHEPFNATLFDVDEDYDRTISAVGFSKEFTNTQHKKVYTNAYDYLESVSSKYGSQMHLMKVNKEAKILISKNFKLSKFNKAVSVVKTPTNGYYIGGYTLDGSLLIAKLDAQANIIFLKTFGTKNYDKMNNLLLLSDGGVLAIGSSFTSRDIHDNMFSTGLGNNDIFMTRFSADGNELWSKKYGTKYDDVGIDAVEAVDGSILVVSTMASSNHQDVSFMRLSENGNRIWLKHYIKHQKNENLTIPKKIIRLKDNNFVVSLVQYNNQQKEHIRLVKFDLYENILADSEIFTTYPSGLNDIAEFSDGRIIGVGYIKDTYNTDGLAMLLDSNLKMLQQEHYGDENYDIFNALKILHNSQVAVVGAHTDSASQEMNMWLLKLNQDLSIAQTALSVNSFYKKLCEIFKNEIANKQLRINEDLSITLLAEELYFKPAQYRLNSQQKSFLELFAKKLLPFLEKNAQKIETLEVNGYTSSEWKTKNFAQRYLNNERLSQKRSFSVISYIFNKQNISTQKFLTNILKGSGLSYSKKVVVNDVEDKDKSRKVAFKIILKK
ncbi:OmpA family protein [Sulfurimonas sp.]